MKAQLFGRVCNQDLRAIKTVLNANGQRLATAAKAKYTFFTMTASNRAAEEIGSGVGRSRHLYLVSISIVIGIMSAAILAEVSARLFFDEPVAPRFVVDSGYGVRANQPNVRTNHYVPGEFFITVSTNSIGLRGTKDYAEQKPPGVKRIAMFGDSFLFGHGVEDGEVVSNVLELQLNAEGREGFHYEVLNFGVSGFGQAEELVSYRARGRDFHPDIVVLFYFQNDIGNNKVSQLFEVSADGILRRKKSEYLPAVRTREILYAFPPIRWLFENSEAWNVVRNRLSSIVQKSKLEQAGLKSFSDSDEVGVELTVALIREFIADTLGDGAHPIVVIIPEKKTMSSNFPLERPDVINAGAELIDGRELLVRDDYWNKDSHWKASGHSKVAAALARRIISKQASTYSVPETDNSGDE